MKSDDNNRLLERLKKETMNHLLVIETMHRADEHIDELRFVLKGLYEDILEYQTINHLGGYNNHWMKAARKVLYG